MNERVNVRDERVIPPGIGRGCENDCSMQARKASSTMS